MSKHTPGCPFCGQKLPDGQEWSMSATLIAAAPELLEACHSILNAHKNDLYPSLVKVVQEAIKKAEGNND